MHKLRVLTGAACFQAVMAVRPCARTAHFMVHHLADVQLSTAVPPLVVGAVDDGVASVLPRLGMVVPKRHARRAVTRNLVKREMREGMSSHGAVLPPGDWVVRLRAPFDPKRYLSASSSLLRDDVRAELAVLIADATRHASSARRAAAGRLAQAAG